MPTIGDVIAKIESAFEPVTINAFNPKNKYFRAEPIEEALTMLKSMERVKKDELSISYCEWWADNKLMKEYNPTEYAVDKLNRRIFGEE